VLARVMGLRASRSIRLSLIFSRTTGSGSGMLRGRKMNGAGIYIVALIVNLIAATPSQARKNRFPESDEAKEADYKKGCAITEYGDLEEADGIDWAWIAPGAKLGGPGGITIGSPVKNVSDVTDVTLASTVEQDFKHAFERIGKTPD